jgi:hypothetical protein
VVTGSGALHIKVLNVVPAKIPELRIPDVKRFGWVV